MKQRILLTLLAALLALSSWAFGTKIDGIYYILNDDNMTASVTYTGTTYYPSDYPNNVNSENPYKGAITIPSTVTWTYTENNRVYYKYYSVTSIGYYAFFDCPDLTSVTIPNSVTSIGSNSFCGCTGLTNINIPNSVTSIEGDAFYGCTGLTNITIPGSVTHIGAFAFTNCDGLTSITIPNSVTSIGKGAFAWCDGLTSVTMPESITSINESVFHCCTSLTNIAIPNSVTSIGRGAFMACDALTQVQLGNGVKTIGEEAFYKCPKLKNILWGESVEIIQGSAFYNCNNLDSISLPNSVISIEGEAFMYCTGLTSVVLPNSLISIGLEAFENCSNLKELIIPNSVTSIGGDAFGGTNLRMLTIGKSVEKIQGGAFLTETGELNNIFVLCLNPPSCSSGAFRDGDYGATLHVPAGTREVYSQTAPWSKFKFIVDDLPNYDTETTMTDMVTTRSTAGDPMTFDVFKALAGTGKHFAIVAVSENSLVYPKWFSFSADGYPTILSPAQLFDLENSETGDDWYNIKRVSDGLYVSTEGGNFSTDPKMDFKLVNRLAGDYWSGFSDASLHISFDNAEGNHYNANTVNLGFRSGTGGYSTYVAYGPFYVVKVNYLDKYNNPLRASETFIVVEGTTIEAPAIMGKAVQGASSVSVSEDQTITFKYEDSTFDYKVMVNGAVEGMVITIKGDALTSGQTDYSNEEAVSESDVVVTFSEGVEFFPTM